MENAQSAWDNERTVMQDTEDEYEKRNPETSIRLQYTIIIKRRMKPKDYERDVTKV